MPIKFTHINLVAGDWKKLAEFYQLVFGCAPVPPERDLSGDWLDRAVDIEQARIRGIHLRLPGTGEDGPTLEIFEYAAMPEHPEIKANTPGFSHIAFEVDDVETVANKVFKQGGTPVGDRTIREIKGVGRIVFQYVTDPEGNIIELQHWTQTG